jgi:hypothetical protein
MIIGPEQANCFTDIGGDDPLELWILDRLPPGEDYMLLTHYTASRAQITADVAVRGI